MPVFGLDKDNVWFPDPTLADDDGLLAIGGDLSLERLILAYSNGIFPWFDPGDDIMWWCPKQRFIIRPGEAHVSHSLKKYMRKHHLVLRLNRDFRDTMHRCRLKREDREGTWISDEMEKAYYELFRYGCAISAEAYVDGELAGGLYGVCLGRSFIGESMFSDMPNGSKLCLVMLSDLLKQNDFLMIDCQLHTPHLESMGGVYISYEEYMKLFNEGMDTGDNEEE